MIDTSKTYDSNNCGKFVITNYIDALNVEIHFLATGYRFNARASTIRSGKIKDPLYPNTYGVGYIGIGNNKASINGKLTIEYVCWFGMINRCYCPYVLNEKQSYRGVTVCDEWLNFQNFSNWHKENYIKGLGIDKDIKQSKTKGKVYSPGTCLFVSKELNVAESSAGNFTFIDPNGYAVDIYNLSKFCRENNLDRSLMGAVNSGNTYQHKGWKKPTNHLLEVK
ncbi:MAG: hypothetical protein V3R25_05875 [Nitrosomonadaceae bacterium]